MNQLRDILLRRVALHAAYVRCFNTDDGKVVLSDLMKEGFMFKPTFVSGDPQASALNEGSRRLVLSILKFVHKDHKELINHVEKELQNE